MGKVKRYCLFLDRSLSLAISTTAAEMGQSQAEFFRIAAIEKTIELVKSLEPETKKFILQRLEKSLLETSDAELNPIAKKKLLELLTPLLRGAR